MCAKDGVEIEPQSWGQHRYSSNWKIQNIKAMRKAIRENGTSHADITISRRMTFFPVMLKRNHVLDIYTKRGCQDMLRAAELLSEQRPVPLSSRQLVGQRGHVNGKLSSMVEGAQTVGRGKARRETSVRRVVLSSSEKIPAQNQSSFCPAHKPTCFSLCPPTRELVMAGRRWREGSTGKGIPFCHLISRKCSKGSHCLSRTRSSKSTAIRRTCMNFHPTCMMWGWLQLARNLLHPRTFCPSAHSCVKEKYFV